MSPFVDEERPYTIWGYMDAGSDTQTVRVFTIEDRIGTDRTGAIDAVVTSTNLTTGEQRVWTDSVVTYFDGTAGHVFWSPFRAGYEHRYRLEVARSDGAVTSVEVTVPSATTIQVDDRHPGAVIPVSIVGDVSNVIDLQVIYEASTAYPVNVWPDVGEPPPPTVVLPVRIPYEDQLRRDGSGWSFEISLWEDVHLVNAEFRRNCLPDSALLRSVEVRFLAADSTWMPPGGSFELDDLIEPGTFSNVENGFGFFGAGETKFRRWLPPERVRVTAGFVVEQPCPSIARPGCEVDQLPCFRCTDRLTPAVRAMFCRPGAGRRVIDGFDAGTTDSPFYAGRPRRGS